MPKPPRHPPFILDSIRLVGMVHLPPLPGAAGARLSISELIHKAVGEAKQLEQAGFDALIVENFGDAPFAADDVPPETIAVMSIIVDHVRRSVRIPVGVNVLRNDALAALAVATAAGAAFIRVNVLSGVYATDQGFITGRARELARLRASLNSPVKIVADIHVKHAAAISQPDLLLAAEETAHRSGADALIVSGAATGKPADVDAARRVKRAVPDRPLWIGSGVTAATVAACLQAADAVIIGTSLKKGGRTTADLDPNRVRAFVRAAAKA